MRCHAGRVDTMHLVNSSPASRSLTGILMMCAGIACLSVNDAIAKTLTADYSPVQILFLRNLIALPVAALIALRMGGRGGLSNLLYGKLP